MRKEIILILGVISILLSIILFSCAKEGMPQGGPRDTVPPVLIRSKPPMFATDFKGKEIVFKFNEYFDLKDINNNFFSSPPFAEKPKFVIKGKDLVVKLKDTLRDSVTYTIGFGDAIVDYHEGNVLKNFTFVFSTYDKIDSLRVRGQVIDAYTQEPVPGVYVMLYKKLDDSVVFREPPQYIARTNDTGKFVIFGIKKGQYKVFALNDLNNNFIYDGIENQVGFLDDLVKPNVSVTIKRDSLKAGTVLHDKKTGKIIDTLKHDTVIVRRIYDYRPYLTISMFKEYSRPQSIVKADRQYDFLIKLRFNFPLIKNKLDVKLLKPALTGKKAVVTEYFENTDSAYLWLVDKRLQKADTVSLQFSYYTPKVGGVDLVVDTIDFYAPKDSVFVFSINAKDPSINYFDPFVFITNTYLPRINKQKIDLVHVVDTTTDKPFKIKPVCVRSEPDMVTVLFPRGIQSQNIDFRINGLPKSKLKYFYDKKENVLNIGVPGDLKYNDTLYFWVYYEVKDLLGYMRPVQCQRQLQLTRQALQKVIWNKQNEVVLIFRKPVSEFTVKNTEPSQIVIDRNIVRLIFDQPVSSLNFSVKLRDYTDVNNNKVFFEKKLKLSYTWPANKIDKISRPDRDFIKIKFARKPDSLVSIKPLRYPEKNWGNYTLSGDTVIIRLENQEMKQSKFVDLLVKYGNRTEDELVIKTDTVVAELGKNPFLHRVEAYEHQDFDIKQVENRLDNYAVTSDFEPNNKYKLIFYPAAFTDIRGISNDTLVELDFRTLATKDYGDLTLTLDKNLQDYLKKHYLIFILYDKNDNPVRTEVLKKSTGRLEIKRLPQGEYKLLIIMDANKNQRWDTGNYLRHEQPEKIIRYPGKLNVKANWEIEESINTKGLDIK